MSKSQELYEKQHGKEIARKEAEEAAAAQETTLQDEFDKKFNGLINVIQKLTIKLDSVEKKLGNNQAEEQAETQEAQAQSEQQAAQPEPAPEPTPEPTPEPQPQPQPAPQQTQQAAQPEPQPQPAPQPAPKKAQPKTKTPLRDGFNYIYEYKTDDGRIHHTTNIFDAKRHGDYTPIPAKFTVDGQFDHVLTDGEAAVYFGV